MTSKITTASDCTTMSAAEVLSALCPGGASRRDVCVEQDWDREETTIRFDDGSALIVCGRDVITVAVVDRMADLIRGASDGDPAIADGVAAGDFACYWTDAEIQTLAAEMGITGPLDCDAIRALVESLDRLEAELGAEDR